MPNPIWNIPNGLSASRIPLGVGLFAAVAAEAWAAGLGLFAVAAFTDWLDGFWARRFGPLTKVGRNLDPLTDKFLICGAFIYLMPVAGAELPAWVVTLVVGREILITGVRGIVEAEGHKFGADAFGKLKTVVQCGWILCVLARLTFAADPVGDLAGVAAAVQRGLLALVVFATAGSGASYLFKAARLLGRPPV